MDDLPLVTHQGALCFFVRAKPRASRSRVLGVKDGQLEVALAAPPVDGEANAELTRCLARQLNLPRSAVTLVAGERSRSKRVAVRGLEPAELVHRLLAKP